VVKIDGLPFTPPPSGRLLRSFILCSILPDHVLFYCTYSTLTRVQQARPCLSGSSQRQQSRLVCRGGILNYNIRGFIVPSISPECYSWTGFGGSSITYYSYFFLLAQMRRQAASARRNTAKMLAPAAIIMCAFLDLLIASV
jgi:hypothetical protein